MWRIFAVLSVCSGASLWHSGQVTLACLAVLSGVLVFWSYYAMGRIAQATENLAGEATSGMESLIVTLNFIASVASLGFTAIPFFL